MHPTARPFSTSWRTVSTRSPTLPRTWGARNRPPYPPHARGAPAKPWHPSILRQAPRAPGSLQQPCRDLGALHAMPDALRVPAVGRTAHPRVPRARPRQARRQPRGLVLVQLGRRLAEVAAAGRLGAVHAGPEFYDIEVALEDSPLGQRAHARPRDGLPRQPRDQDDRDQAEKPAEPGAPRPPRGHRLERQQLVAKGVVVAQRGGRAAEADGALLQHVDAVGETQREL